jgi:hypothetical protein
VPPLAALVHLKRVRAVVRDPDGRSVELYSRTAVEE